MRRSAAMVSSWVFAHDGRFGRGWPEASLLIGALTLASGPLIQAGIVDDANGLLQRLGMWPALPWMSVVAWRLFPLAAVPASVVTG